MKTKLILIVVLLAAISGTFFWLHHDNSKAAQVQLTQKSSKVPASNNTAAAKPAAKAGACDSNTSSQVVIVSIGQQHMWACDGTKVAYDNPVVTGMQQYPSELTPLGTYHIYSKLTDQTLAGSDFTGHWSDYVYYWMPFLDNQYGTYGFHDLTDTANGAAGRADSDFGNIDINAPYTAAKHGSHGCVELPLAAAKWLYNWSSVGTTVTIQA
jgi:lipoprotein-anchoring transpeptidase ErfK/SrfK